jgi:hypothetical protein
LYTKGKRQNGINTVSAHCVAAMNDAIDKIAKCGEFISVAIDENTIPDFMERLQIYKIFKTFLGKYI